MTRRQWVRAPLIPWRIPRDAHDFVIGAPSACAPPQHPGLRDRRPACTRDKSARYDAVAPVLTRGADRTPSGCKVLDDRTAVSSGETSAGLIEEDRHSPSAPSAMTDSSTDSVQRGMRDPEEFTPELRGHEAGKRWRIVGL